MWTPISQPRWRPLRTARRELQRRLGRLVPRSLRGHEGELAYIGASALAVALVAGLGAAFWQSPWSPIALDRPAAQVALGHHDAALADYEALAQGWGPTPVLEEAAWRAAQLRAVDPAAPDAAATALLRFIETWPESAHLPDAWARLAAVYGVGLGEPLRAAEAYEYAAWAAPDHDEAGRWLLEAGRGFATAGHTESAERALGLATQHEPRAASAWLALARVRLATDPNAAYEAYDMALRAAGDGPAANLARLGRATALERLEGGDAALAQLDGELAETGGDAALVRRAERLRHNR